MSYYFALRRLLLQANSLAGYVIAPAVLTESSADVYSSSDGVAGETLAFVSQAQGEWTIADYAPFEDGRAAYGTAPNLAYLFRFYGRGFTLAGYMGPDGADFTVKINGQVVGTGSNYSATTKLGTWFSWQSQLLNRYEVEVTKGAGTAFYCDTINLFG